MRFSRRSVSMVVSTQDKCAICKCKLPPKDVEIPIHMTLNRTTVLYPGVSKMRDVPTSVHHVCLPLKGRKWDYFKSGTKEPGFFLKKSSKRVVREVRKIMVLQSRHDGYVHHKISLFVDKEKFKVGDNVKVTIEKEE